MKQLNIFLILGFLLPGIGSAQVVLEQTTVDTSTLITGLDIPWEMQWGPDDQLWITERFGRISRIDPETGQQDVVLDLSSQVHQSGESGLLGLVLHPQFNNMPYVYAAYTYKPGSQILEKVVRFEYDGSGLVNEYILIDNIPGATTHNGCRLLILPDNTLLITTGDAQNQPASQNLEHLSGKVLRLNLDGTVPADNPWPGNPVYTLGHRNAQGLFYSDNGMIYSSEHGPSTDDELNIIEPGRNYGWPNVHGYCDLPGELDFCEEFNVYEPIRAWTPTIATSDIIVYDHPSIPEWQGKILLTSLKNKRLYVMELDDNGTTILGEDQYFTNYWGRLRDVVAGPDGTIYLATNGSSWSNTQPFTHSIIKITNPGYVSGSSEVTADQTQLQLYPNPFTSSFTVRSPSIIREILLSNSTGHVVKKLVIDRNEVQIDGLANLPPGIYILQVRTKNGIVRRPVVKIK